KVVVLFGLALLLFYGLGVVAGALLPASFSQQDISPENADGSIYLAHNGYHVEMCLPVASAPEELLEQLYMLHPALSSERPPEYLRIGWGDRVFYPGTPSLSQLEIIPTFRAILLPTQAAMRISWHYSAPTEDESVKKIPVTTSQIKKLYAFVSSSYMYDNLADIKLVPLPETMIDPSYESSVFIAASGTYSLLYTSNNWTNKALQKAGIPTRLWTPTVWGVGR
ncbi:MAG: DUF2459 domain-containing protein, partial [Spirochaetota bacterium]